MVLVQEEPKCTTREAFLPYLHTIFFAKSNIFGWLRTKQSIQVLLHEIWNRPPTLASKACLITFP